MRPEDVGGTLRFVARSRGGRALTKIASTGLVRPAAPALAAAPALGTAQEGHTVSVGAGTWTSSRPVAVVYQWRRCSAARACSAIAGARSPTYAVQTFDVDSSLEVVVAAANAGGSTPYTVAFPKPVVPAPPRSTSPATIAGSAYEGVTLAGETGSWASSRPVAISHTWRRCDYAGANCARIEGASGRTYVVRTQDLWKTIRFSVEGSNGGGTATSTSSGAVAPTYTLTSREAGSTVRVVVTASTGRASASATSAPTAVVAAASIATVLDEPPPPAGPSPT